MKKKKNPRSEAAKKNPQDATLRNNRARIREIALIQDRLDIVFEMLYKMEVGVFPRLNVLEKQVFEIQGMAGRKK